MLTSNYFDLAFYFFGIAEKQWVSSENSKCRQIRTQRTLGKTKFNRVSEKTLRAKIISKHKTLEDAISEFSLIFCDIFYEFSRVFPFESGVFVIILPTFPIFAVWLVPIKRLLLFRISIFAWWLLFPELQKLNFLLVQIKWTKLIIWYHFFPGIGWKSVI